MKFNVGFELCGWETAESCSSETKIFVSQINTKTADMSHLVGTVSNLGENAFF